MIDDLGERVLAEGDSVRFEDRDDLLEKLDDLDRRIPARRDKRGLDHREHFCMVRYLRFLAGGEPGLLPLPVTLNKSFKNQDPPDFVLQWDGSEKETFEVTEGSTEEYQRSLSQASANRGPWPVPVDVQIPGEEAVERWVEILFQAFHNKTQVLSQGRFELDHLLIYDLTGLGLFVPFEDGHSLFREKIRAWLEKNQPAQRFRRVSVLRDQALLLDIAGPTQILKAGSPYFQLPALRANGGSDLRQRLRDIDRFCRRNAIRDLKLFGSVLGDRDDGLLASEDALDGTETRRFGPDSDLDLLVEFEPTTRVTLFDMARLERELGDLTGFKVDLHTAGDLSRYFRNDVLKEAVEIRVRPA